MKMKRENLSSLERDTKSNLLWRLVANRLASGTVEISAAVGFCNETGQIPSRR